MAEGNVGGKEIQRLAKGDKSRTARHSDMMNEIIDALNALQNITISPQSLGKFVYAAGNVVLQLNLANASNIPDPPPSGTFVLGAIDGGVQWIATQDCAGEIDGGSA